jgi:deoxyribodipyrimidine photo-lyase
MPSGAAPIIVWFRQDLRLSDNPALSAAVVTGRPLVAVYILDDENSEKWRPGGASRWWLHHSLTSLMADLARLGLTLTLRRGDPCQVIPALLGEAGGDAVFWNRCLEPYAVARDGDLKVALKQAGIDARSFNAALLREPWEVKTKEGNAFRVYSPFWRACLALGDPPAPLSAPTIVAPGPSLAGCRLEELRLLPNSPDWAGGLRAEWQPGEEGARTRLSRFLDEALHGYKSGRDRPDRGWTSRLSPHLHFGEIGPRQIWHATRNAVAASGRADSDAEKFLGELGWREFSYHLLFRYPDLPAHPLRREFEAFPWREDGAALRAWQKGKTGYPVVDAGMRELWTTGWMHNRVRMVVASFLVKHLLIPWQAGEAWFWDTLVDADLAANAASWQWVAGCGADAAPYFRIFNPVIQGQKFDPEGDYVRRWVPELTAIPTKYIHQPWSAPELVLRNAGITLGATYPCPIVEHSFARRRALEAFAGLSGAADAAD